MKPTIYLIDDDPAILALLAEITKSLGLITESFTRAKYFFRQISSFETGSILVLDLLIPEEDGIEVMKKLAKMENPPALILISGRGIDLLNSAEKLGQADNLKILGCLNKSDMVDKFQQLLEQHIPTETLSPNSF